MYFVYSTACYNSSSISDQEEKDDQIKKTRKEISQVSNKTLPSLAVLDKGELLPQHFLFDCISLLYIKLFDCATVLFVI